MGFAMHHAKLLVGLVAAFFSEVVAADTFEIINLNSLNCSGEFKGKASYYTCGTSAIVINVETSQYYHCFATREQASVNTVFLHDRINGRCIEQLRPSTAAGPYSYALVDRIGVQARIDRDARALWVVQKRA